MTDFKENFEIDPNLIVNIKRIFINQNIIENYKLIPIQNSAFYTVGTQLDRVPYGLPKLYAALTYLTGPSDLYYDYYKGSFSFMFELEVQKNQKISQYLYHIYHYRSYIEFSVFQMLPKTDPRDINIMHKPDDMLFSEQDICHFSSYFCGYCLGYIKITQHIPKDFIKSSDSNLLLFGYSKNEYFIREYTDQIQYRREKSLKLTELTM